MRAAFTIPFLALGSGWVQAQAPLPVYYIEKPPYYHTHNDQPVGFLLERAARVFDAAGIAVRFESRPAKRILHDIAHLQTAACSIGWFKTPEREAFAWFSPPIHQDAPMRVLTRRDTAARIDAQAERALLFKGPLRLGLVDGFSYGTLDADLKDVKSYMVTAPPAQIVQMLVANRIDYTLIDALEWPYMTAALERGVEVLSQIRLVDMPPGQYRYLMCSRALNDAGRARIEQAIRTPGLVPSEF